MGDKLVVWLNRKVDEVGSIRALARKAELSHTTLSEVLSGVRKPTHKVCTAVARAMNEPEERILRLAGLISPRPKMEEEEELLLHYFDQLAPDDQERLLDVAKTFVEAERREDRPTSKPATTAAGEA
jgi:transcriptional regulator with XRE-family HTH domain